MSARPPLAGLGWAGGQPWVLGRLAGAAVLFVALFGMLGRQAFVLQIRRYQEMRRRAEEQSRRDIALPARRGRLLDRNGAELAASVEVDSVAANPRQLASVRGGVEAAARALAGPLGLDARDLARRLAADDKHYFAWVKRHVTPEEARAVRELGLAGIHLEREPRRYYPGRERAGPLLGWVGLDGRGLEGLELQHERELRPVQAAVPGLRDARGTELLTAGTEDAPGRPGHDVETTIDKFIQYRLEQALEAGVARHHARAGTAVALDPRSGEVLAMAAVPTTNPNDPAPVAGARNRAVTDPFEPGSTMKTFSIGAAIEAGLVKPDDRWYCENGHMKVGRFTIHDAEPIGEVTTTGVLAESSNICTAKIARRSGRERVEALLRRFHFGAPIGVDLPGERPGILRAAHRWGEIELATISFGQGMTATPLQVAAGYAAIANDGVWVRPHLARRILDERGRVLREAPREAERVLDAGTARTLRAMLHAVTLKGGTAESLAIPGYPAAGKTGTAQKVDPATRRYSTEKWASSFVGFAPLDDPRLLLFVMIDEPVGTHYGSQVAGPVWREVMVEALRYLNVPAGPDASPPPAPPSNARHAATAVAGSPAAPPPAPAVPAAVVDGLQDGDGGDERGGDGEEGEATRMPDFTGLSMGEVLSLARRLRLPIEVLGTGLAVRQEPGPGEALQSARCRVTFAPPG